MHPSLVGLAERTKGLILLEEGMSLYETARTCVGPFLEIGSYCGRSGIFLGQAAKEQNTVLYTIDHHGGSEEMHAGRHLFDPKTVIDGIVNTYPILLETIEAANLKGVVLPFVGRAHDIAQQWHAELGYCFIDGAHDLPTVQTDADDWVQWVRVGGMLAFHDSPFDGVAPVIEHVLATGNWEHVTQAESLLVLRRLA